MINKIIHLHKRPFFRNVATVATGTVLAQSIVVAFAPIITRIYGPEAFGMLGVFIAITSVLIPVATLTYSISIVLPSKDEDALVLAKLSILIAFGIAVIAALLLFFFKDPLINLLRIHAIERFVFLVPYVLFFSAFSQSLQQWMIRKKQYKTTALITVTDVISLNGIKVFAGLFWPTASILVILAAFGSSLNAALFGLGAKRTLNFSGNLFRFNRATLSKMKVLARNYRDFPMYRAPQVFLNSMSLGLPVLMLTSLFGPASAGFYALGKRVLEMPGQILGKSISDVFYPRIAEAGNKGEDLRHLVVRATLGLSAIGILPYGLVFLLGPWLFGVVFGSDWTVAGEYARWISLWSFFGFINKPSIISIPVLKMQGLFLCYEIVSVSLRLVALFAGFYFYGSDLTAVAFFSISGVIINAIIILYVIKRSGKKVHLRDNVVITGLNRNLSESSR